MAPSMNRFRVVVLLVLIASTGFLMEKAQARGFHSCMNVCPASYLLCANFCFAQSLGYNQQLMQRKNGGRVSDKDSTPYQAPKVQGGEEQHLYPKHPRSKHNENVKHRSKHNENLKHQSKHNKNLEHRSKHNENVENRLKHAHH